MLQVIYYSASRFTWTSSGSVLFFVRNCSLLLVSYPIPTYPSCNENRTWSTAHTCSTLLADWLPDWWMLFNILYVFDTLSVKNYRIKFASFSFPATLRCLPLDLLSVRYPITELVVPCRIPTPAGWAVRMLEMLMGRCCVLCDSEAYVRDCERWC